MKVPMKIVWPLFAALVAFVDFGIVYWLHPDLLMQFLCIIGLVAIVAFSVYDDNTSQYDE